MRTFSAAIPRVNAAVDDEHQGHVYSKVVTEEFNTETFQYCIYVFEVPQFQLSA